MVIRPGPGLPEELPPTGEEPDAGDSHPDPVEPEPDAGEPEPVEPAADAGEPVVDAGEPAVVVPPVDAGSPSTPGYFRTHYVSTSGSDSNPGTSAAPFRTVGKALSAVSPGERILVRAGTYDGRISINGAVRAGTSTGRILLEGEGKPKLVNTAASAVLLIEKPYWTVQGFDIDAQSRAQFAVAFMGDNTGTVLRQNEIHHGSAGAGVSTHAGSTGATIEENDIHDFWKDLDDSHGIIVQFTSKNVTIRNNSIHDNSGDSIQCYGPEDSGGTGAPADGVLIEGNDLFRSQEQAVDIKTCHNVTVRKNKLHLFRRHPVRGGNGAMVVHYSPKNVLIEENDFYDSGLGVGVGGNLAGGPPPSGVVIRKNLFHDMLTLDGMTGGGVRIDVSDGTQVYNNTFARLPAYALYLGGGNGGSSTHLSAKNNLFAGGNPFVRIGSAAPGVQVDGNLYGPGGTLSSASGTVSFTAWKELGFDAKGFQADPQLNPDTFVPGPAAVDKALPVGLPFCGAAADIGAVETGC